MANVTAFRNTKKSSEGPLQHEFVLPLGAGVKLWGGTLACSSAGFLVAPTASTTIKCWGRLEDNADNTGGLAGAISAPARPGVYLWANSSAGDLIAQADVGNTCFVVDNQTVAKTNGTNTRSAAGIITAVGPEGVWVASGPGVSF